jgi:hypothetical protein
MILHLGGDTAVPLKDIIAIFDMSSALLSDVNREFLEVAREEGFVKEVCKGEYKTFILAEINNKTAIFLSPISSATLLKRSGFYGGVWA